MASICLGERCGVAVVKFVGQIREEDVSYPTTYTNRKQSWTLHQYSMYLLIVLVKLCYYFLF